MTYTVQAVICCYCCFLVILLFLRGELVALLVGTLSWYQWMNKWIEPQIDVSLPFLSLESIHFSKSFWVYFITFKFFTVIAKLTYVLSSCIQHSCLSHFLIFTSVRGEEKWSLGVCISFIMSEAEHFFKCYTIFLLGCWSFSPSTVWFWSQRALMWVIGSASWLISLKVSLACAKRFHCGNCIQDVAQYKPDHCKDLSAVMHPDQSGWGTRV